jgi:hypothetical protein
MMDNFPSHPTMILASLIRGKMHPRKSRDKVGGKAVKREFQCTPLPPATMAEHTVARFVAFTSVETRRKANPPRIASKTCGSAHQH